MRNHRSLTVFKLADQLALLTYRQSERFPAHEMFGLRAQMRRAALSVPTDLVEGAARHSEKEFRHFMCIAYGSARELEYQLSLAKRLGYLFPQDSEEIEDLCAQTCKALRAFITRLHTDSQLPRSG